jgi:hypothetical protein
MDELAEKHGDEVIFIMVNTRTMDDAKQYKSSKGLTSSKLLHAANRPPAEYSLRKIPHKVVIGKDGLVKKNYAGVDLPQDVAFWTLENRIAEKFGP